MTLATKNGSLILKDGALAENCGCCGGWYCCASPACIADSVKSVTATVVTQDYLVQRYLRLYLNSISAYSYQHASVGLVGSFYSGSFTLSRIGASNVWRYDYPQQRSGTCTGHIQISVDQFGWQSQFSWSVVSHVMYTQSAAILSSEQAIAAGTYKELSEMQCAPGGVWSGLAGDSFAGWPTNPGPTKTLYWSGVVGTCSTLLSLPWPVTFQAVYPPPFTPSGLSFEPNQRKEEGTNGITLSISVEQ